MTAIAYTLRYKKSTDSVYVPVPVGSATALPTYVDKGTFTSGTGALSVPAPAGIQANDVLILAVESANEAITTPSGYTQVTNSPQSTGTAASAGGVRVGVFYKVTSGTESNLTVADTGNHTTAIITAYRGCDPTTPIHVTAGGVDSSATSSLSCPAVATTLANCMIVNLIGLDKDLADSDTLSSVANASLANVTERHDQTIASGVGGGLAVITGEKATAGSSGNTTATGDTSTTHAYVTIALAPAPVPIYISTSANITAGGVATTAQLTPPSGKTTSDFTTGRMWDDENGVDTIDIATNGYTELEWCIQAQAPATTSDVYQFRVYEGSTPLDTYTVTPQWTIGTGSITLVVAGLAATSTIGAAGSLTQHQALAVAGLSATSTVGATGALVQHYGALTVAGLSATSTVAAAGALTQHQAITVADVGATSTLAATGALTQHQAIAVAGLSATSSIGAAGALTQHQSLAVDGLAAASTLGNVNLSQAGTLAVDGLTAATTLAATGALVQHQSLTVAGLSATSTVAAAGALVQHQAIAVDGAGATSTLGNVSLSTSGNLPVDGLAAASTLGAPALTQHQVLAVAGMSATATLAAAGGLTQHQAIAVDGAAAASTLGNVVLVPTGSLGPTTLQAASTLAAVNLTQHYGALTVAGMTAGATLETPTLAQHYGALVVAGATSTSTIGATGPLTQHQTLTVASLTAGAHVDAVTLTAAAIALVVAGLQALATLTPAGTPPVITGPFVTSKLSDARTTSRGIERRTTKPADARTTQGAT